MELLTVLYFELSTEQHILIIKWVFRGLTPNVVCINYNTKQIKGVLAKPVFHMAETYISVKITGARRWSIYLVSSQETVLVDVNAQRQDPQDSFLNVLLVRNLFQLVTRKKINSKKPQKWINASSIEEPMQKSSILRARLRDHICDDLVVILSCVRWVSS